MHLEVGPPFTEGEERDGRGQEGQQDMEERARDVPKSLPFVYIRDMAETTMFYLLLVNLLAFLHLLFFINTTVLPLIRTLRVPYPSRSMVTA